MSEVIAEGNLQEFALHEIIRLNGISGSLSLLTLELEDAVAELLLMGERVLYARLRSGEIDPLSRLLKDGVVSESPDVAKSSALGTASCVASASPGAMEVFARVRAVEDMLKSRVLSSEILQVYLKESAVEVARRIMGLASGRFMLERADAEAAISIPGVEVVAELRDIGAELVRKAGAALESLSSSGLAPEVDEAFLQGSKEIHLSTQEWRVLALADGRRSIEELARALDVPLQVITHIIARLVAAGALRIAKPKRLEEKPSVELQNVLEMPTSGAGSGASGPGADEQAAAGPERKTPSETEAKRDPYLSRRIIMKIIDGMTEL